MIAETIIASVMAGSAVCSDYFESPNRFMPQELSEYQECVILTTNDDTRGILGSLIWFKTPQGNLISTQLDSVAENPDAFKLKILNDIQSTSAIKLLELTKDMKDDVKQELKATKIVQQAMGNALTMGKKDLIEDIIDRIKDTVDYLEAYEEIMKEYKKLEGQMGIIMADAAAAKAELKAIENELIMTKIALDNSLARQNFWENAYAELYELYHKGQQTIMSTKQMMKTTSSVYDIDFDIDISEMEPQWGAALDYIQKQFDKEVEKILAQAWLEKEIELNVLRGKLTEAQLEISALQTTVDNTKAALDESLARQAYWEGTYAKLYDLYHTQDETIQQLQDQLNAAHDRIDDLEKFIDSDPAGHLQEIEELKHRVDYLERVNQGYVDMLDEYGDIIVWQNVEIDDLKSQINNLTDSLNAMMAVSNVPDTVPQVETPFHDHDRIVRVDGDTILIGDQDYDGTNFSLDQVEAMAVNAYNEGYDDGYQDGYADGYADGFADGVDSVQGAR